MLTLGVWPLTLPARAREPWTFPVGGEGKRGIRECGWLIKLTSAPIISHPASKRTPQEARGELQGGEFREGALSQHGVIVQGGPTPQQHLLLRGDARQRRHLRLGGERDIGGVSHPKKGLTGGGRDVTHTQHDPFQISTHLDLGDGLGTGDLEGVEGLGTDEELHGELGGKGLGGPPSKKIGGGPAGMRGGEGVVTAAPQLETPQGAALGVSWSPRLCQG